MHCIGCCPLPLSSHLVLGALVQGRLAALSDPLRNIHLDVFRNARPLCSVRPIFAGRPFYRLLRLVC
ncbi:hypothetical protein PF008_g24264 [Phytophthora fragariae]|uniref:Secreted protein n=1 Tax=Phytophthora fragariae TaxID=53985 RepID=A0A6G0QP84_9STRA|nr:hypothetical protein PF008_g24264 [Phytophthora fragariae]